MFEGKIRPCLECRTIEIKRNASMLGWVDISCYCGDIRLYFAKYGHSPLSMNQWNLANTPPADLLAMEIFYALHEMEIPS